MSLFTPIRVGDFELTAPSSLEAGPQHRTARVLVRWHGEPLGFVCVPVRLGVVRADDLSRAAVTQLAARLAEAAVARRLREGGWRRGLDFDEWFDAAPPPGGGSRVSVVVCTRDRPGEIGACLEAIGRLDPRPLEVVVVDNAPSDEATREVVAGRFRWVRYVREETPGLDHARNRGVRESRGEVIAFTDDDVRVDPRWVGEVQRAFDADPELGLVTGLVEPAELETEAQSWFEVYGGFGRGFRAWHRVHRRGRAISWTEAGVGEYGAGANMALRRTALVDTGLFDPALDVGTPSRGGGDLDIFFRVFKSGWLCRYEPKALVRHRHRREMAGLVRQMGDYGHALRCTFEKIEREFPEDRRALAKLRRWYRRHWTMPRLFRSLRLRWAYPLRLIVAELRGYAEGRGGYERSRRAVVSDEAAAPDHFMARIEGARPIGRCEVVRVDLAEPPRPLPEGRDREQLELLVSCAGRPLGRHRIHCAGRTVSVARLADELAARFWYVLLELEAAVPGAGHADLMASLRRRLELDQPPEERLPVEIPVTVIVPTCGRGDSLRGALRSLARLEVERPLEVVVIDNRPGGWDRSLLEAEFSGVRWLEEPRAGVSYARNAGIAAARGEIIAMVDDDVEVEPGWLEALLAPFERRDVIGVAGTVLPASLASESACEFEAYGGLDRGPDSWDCGPGWFVSRSRRALPTWQLGGTANFAVRASYFEGRPERHLAEWLGPGQPSGVGEDTLLFYQILAAGGTIAYRPQAVVRHHHRASMEELGKQVYNYSKGHIGYHLTTLVMHRDTRALNRILLELPWWMVRCVWRRLRGDRRRSWRVLGLEVAGYLVGPWSLWRSWRGVRRAGAGARREGAGEIAELVIPAAAAREPKDAA